MSACLERNDLILEYLRVGVIEPRINQVDLLARLGKSSPGHQVESALRRFRARKNKRGAPEHRRTRRPHRQTRIESAGQNFSGGAKKRFRICHHFEFSAAQRVFDT